MSTKTHNSLLHVVCMFAVVSNKNGRILSMGAFAGNDIVVDDCVVEVDEVKVS